jgi:hypothetical protein
MNESIRIETPCMVYRHECTNNLSSSSYLPMIQCKTSASREGLVASKVFIRPCMVWIGASAPPKVLVGSAAKISNNSYLPYHHFPTTTRAIALVSFHSIAPASLSLCLLVALLVSTCPSLVLGRFLVSCSLPILAPSWRLEIDLKTGFIAAINLKLLHLNWITIAGTDDFHGDQRIDGVSLYYPEHRHVFVAPVALAQAGIMIK